MANVAYGMYINITYMTNVGMSDVWQPITFVSLQNTTKTIHNAIKRFLLLLTVLLVPWPAHPSIAIKAQAQNSANEVKRQCMSQFL